MNGVRAPWATGRRARLVVAALFLLGGLVGGLTALTGSADAGGGLRTSFRFQDPLIRDSVGLVDLGRVMVTANGGSHRGLLFVVDPSTGRTVGTVEFARQVVDVQALAPAGPRSVWVGDIGDPAENRRTIAVYKVPVLLGHHVVRAPRYRLAYPDGPHHAQTLVAGLGRLAVVTFTAGQAGAYAVPVCRLSTSRVNPLHRVGRIWAWATDGAVVSDPRFVLLRGYDHVVLATFPGFVKVWKWQIPSQIFGTGVSSGPGGRIRLSASRRGFPVRQLRLPAVVWQRMRAVSGPMPKALWLGVRRLWHAETLRVAGLPPASSHHHRTPPTRRPSTHRRVRHHAPKWPHTTPPPTPKLSSRPHPTGKPTRRSTPTSHPSSTPSSTPSTTPSPTSSTTPSPTSTTPPHRPTHPAPPTTRTTPTGPASAGGSAWPVWAVAGVLCFGGISIGVGLRSRGR